MKVLQMSLAASFLILVIMLFRKLFSARMPRQVFSFLWILAWCKLMIPISAGIPIPVADGLAEFIPDIPPPPFPPACPSRQGPGRQPRHGRILTGIY